jgi:hypothetical protein
MTLALDLLAFSLRVIALGSALFRATRGLGSIDVVITRWQGIGVVCFGGQTAEEIVRITNLKFKN